MKEIVAWLEGKKTFIVSFAMIVFALIVTGWQDGDWASAWEQILVALGLSGLRLGIEKK